MTLSGQGQVTVPALIVMMSLPAYPSIMLLDLSKVSLLVIMFLSGHSLYNQLSGVVYGRGRGLIRF